VQAIGVPTHVIVGEEDIMLPPRFSRALAQSIPGAELTVIPGGAHALHAEKPAEFNRAVLDFLKRH
jgi:pimeloyl-ACP methyl ester carboxylesterase